ncbi:hypothetical protein D9Q98_002848 [Chlorella vulgaris]|uniref:Uncharacterized protein n=1 Tax=Chlorella vulgaris TaxID=3077 RepID=A0A9D4TVH3_CHLVU|nr:hypothetical protein D9Q98_002848 [Chlorella vulgaris]
MRRQAVSPSCQQLGRPRSGAASRRGVLSSAAAVLLLAAGQRPSFATLIPDAPVVGDCPECIGEVNETLNACPLDAPSCISTLSDDEEHFAAPWQFDGTREEAIEQLISIATGARFDMGLIDSFGGVRQTDAAAYIAKGVLAVVSGGDMPEQPKRQRKSSTEFVPFDGDVTERRTTPGGAEYVRIVLGTGGGGATQASNLSEVIDCEFLFLPDDNIVDVRASSRVQPEGKLGSGGQLALSITEGLVLDKNVAGRQVERLRKALRWDVAPVLTDFNPAFNAEAPVWFERLFDPFNRRNKFQPSGLAYPAEGEGEERPLRLPARE